MPTIQVHPVKFMKPLIRNWPILWNKHLMQTPNTTRTCLLCGGSISGGLTATHSTVTNTFTIKKCQLCGGSREMKRSGYYDR